MPGLDIDEHMRFQRQEWRFERIGWACVWAFMACGLIGLAGHGPLSSARQESGAISLRYHRFTHITQPEDWKLRLRPQAAAGEAAIVVSGSIVRSIEITAIKPEPSRQEVRPDGGIAMFIDVAPGVADFDVVVDFEIVNAGRHKGRIEHAGDAVEFATFAYP